LGLRRVVHGAGPDLESPLGWGKMGAGAAFRLCLRRCSSWPTAAQATRRASRDGSAGEADIPAVAPTPT